MMPATTTGVPYQEALALLNSRMDYLRREIQRRQYALDPEGWIEHRAKETIWSGQKKIVCALRDHRRVAVRTCHDVGKSFIAARVAAWWLDTHALGEAFVFTSAPSAAQVRAILWREMARVHEKASLRGRLNQTEWWMNIGERDELVAMGRKPSEYSPTASQGIHARYVLVILDEAGGIPGPLWESVDSLIANDESKILVIGNADDLESEFYNVCKPHSGWYVIGISAFDTPNLTGEELPAKIKRELIGRAWIEEKRKKWAPRWQWNALQSVVEPPIGEDSADNALPAWYSKVLGVFPPKSAQQTLIPYAWIEAAKERRLKAEGTSDLGVDVGGGGDESTGCHAHGPVARIVFSDRNPDTMQTCGNVIRHLKECGASRAKIDTIGIGRGVVDRGKELDEPFIGINASSKPTTEEAQEEYENFRAEMGWTLRKRFEAGLIDIDPNDEDLIEELRAFRFKSSSRGKILLESKDEIKKRLGRSPNRADALMLAYAPVLDEEEDALDGQVVW